MHFEKRIQVRAFYSWVKTRDDAVVPHWGMTLITNVAVRLTFQNIWRWKIKLKLGSGDNSIPCPRTVARKSYAVYLVLLKLPSIDPPFSSSASLFMLFYLLKYPAPPQSGKFLLFLLPKHILDSSNFLSSSFTLVQNTFL